MVERNGLRPTQVLDYPPQLAALNRTYANVVELTVRAVLEERPDYVRHRRAARPEHVGDADARRGRRALRRADRWRTATLIPAALRGTASSRGWRSHERDPARPRSRRSTRTACSAVDDVDLEIAEGEFVRPRRPVGLRQVDAAADDRRARGRHGRRHLDRRRRTSPTSRRSSATSRWSSRTTRSTRT